MLEDCGKSMTHVPHLFSLSFSLPPFWTTWVVTPGGRPKWKDFSISHEFFFCLLVVLENRETVPHKDCIFWGSEHSTSGFSGRSPTLRRRAQHTAPRSLWGPSLMKQHSAAEHPGRRPQPCLLAGFLSCCPAAPRPASPEHSHRALAP